MSRLISRILLAIFMFPIAGLIYLQAYVLISDWRIWTYFGAHRGMEPLASGLITWAFIAVYWTVLWYSSVRWNISRVMWTIAAVLLAAMIGLMVISGLQPLNRDYKFDSFIGSVLAPMLWLIATVFIWRETRIEARTRIGSSQTIAPLCPACGYNLTGLNTARCPECGAEFTLDELLAAQQSTTRGTFPP